MSRAMLRRFRITYDLDGWVSAYVVDASSKYNAKQRFYLHFPSARIIKVEVDAE